MPLKKRVAPSSPSDFRPISLLYMLSKVLERLTHDQISEYLANKGLLYPLQTGFRRHNSTQTALLKLTDDVRLNIDKKHMTQLLQFDFSRASDTVSPTHLLERLRRTEFSMGSCTLMGHFISL
ncbi:uncharacterized protein LOC106640884 [Copidosoma floridanum]|uniref:uncharacterized protein LOC106640884 n=1 Tax=Copidosoma floridanum TaxID=29053 RepID=UPI0006C95253|nr:uncharacterized protein LOC106640884 [Copidosoma floridanum]